MNERIFFILLFFEIKKLINLEIIKINIYFNIKSNFLIKINEKINIFEFIFI